MARGENCAHPVLEFHGRRRMKSQFMDELGGIGGNKTEEIGGAVEGNTLFRWKHVDQTKLVFEGVKVASLMHQCGK